MTDPLVPRTLGDGDWRTLLVSIPPAEVLTLTALMEACDNLAIVRTVDPAKGRLAVWCHAAAEAIVEEQLAWLSARIPLVVLERTNGMKYLPPAMVPDAAP